MAASISSLIMLRAALAAGDGVGARSATFEAPSLRTATWPSLRFGASIIRDGAGTLRIGAGTRFADRSSGEGALSRPPSPSRISGVGDLRASGAGTRFPGNLGCPLFVTLCCPLFVMLCCPISPPLMSPCRLPGEGWRSRNGLRSGAGILWRSLGFSHLLYVLDV